MATPLLKQLRPLRLLRGFTQEALAEKIAVTRPFIAQLESGARQGLETSKLLRLADALGVSVEVLFADELPFSCSDDSIPDAPRGALSP